MLDAYVAYHNRSAAYHQQQIDSLSTQGYRLISLSLYGDPKQPLYAGVWIKRGGNAWYTFHSVDNSALSETLRLLDAARVSSDHLDRDRFEGYGSIRGCL